MDTLSVPFAYKAMIVGHLVWAPMLLMRFWRVLAQEHLMLIGALIMSVSIYPMGLYLVLIGIDENIAALTYGTIVPLFLGALLLCLGSARDL